MDPQFHVKLLRLYTLSARYIKLTVLYSGVEICVHINRCIWGLQIYKTLHMFIFKHAHKQPVYV